MLLPINRTGTKINLNKTTQTRTNIETRTKVHRRQRPKNMYQHNGLEGCDLENILTLLILLRDKVSLCLPQQADNNNFAPLLMLGAS